MGGEAAVRRLVDRFYDIMDSSSEALELRTLHATDLGPMATARIHGQSRC